MYLIVGIGNKGRTYKKTRHNLGFHFLDAYYKKHSLNNEKEKFNAKYVETEIGGEKVIFIKPQSYVNLSGEVVYQFQRYYKIPTENILIIVDDLDLNTGVVRLRRGGSSGGHNGLKDIFKYLKTQDIKRLKIGISNDKEMLTRDYVLSKFSREERKKLKEIEDKVINIIDDFPIMDFDDLMNKYN